MLKWYSMIIIRYRILFRCSAADDYALPLPEQPSERGHEIGCVVSGEELYICTGLGGGA